MVAFIIDIIVLGVGIIGEQISLDVVVPPTHAHPL